MLVLDVSSFGGDFPAMKYRSLCSTGLRVSAIGFGASPFGDVFRPVSDEGCQAAVASAIEGGINFFDVSPYYGLTLAETRLGKALGGRRQSICLATKCGRYGVNRFDFSRRRLLQSIDESLSRLQTDYVDLLQAHDIEFAQMRQILDETIPALLEIKAAGKTRFIGISSYQLRIMADLAQTQRIDTVLSYCRSNLLADDANRMLIPVLQGVGIGLINASPLHMGILTPGGPPAWHPAPEAVREAGAAAVRLCLAHGLSPMQVALRLCLDERYAASTLIGMSSPEEVKENLAALILQLDPDFLRQLRAIVAPVMNSVWPSGLIENADDVYCERHPS